MSTWFTYSLILLLPLIQGIALFIIRRRSVLIPLILIGMLTGLGLSVRLLWGYENDLISRFEWLPGFEMGWRLDKLGLSLIALVYFISTLVHVFSTFYLSGKETFRYFAKLGFFTSAMIGLLAADHLILLFIFWELVGFASYLLIGFWYTDKNNSQASRNAFITNRVADIFLLAGILLFWVNTDSLFISELSVPSEGAWLTLASVGLLIGAMGKSAQFPFHTWLPHAMAGPTPVSALIHAATMVAAGVYLLVRVSFIFPEPVLLATSWIGGVTLVLAAFFALTQFDIKKVLAYSTISQLGYMILAIGVGAPEMGFFHLWTHAFFKAALFLTAGAIIHEMHHRHSDLDPQDMRYMGNLRKELPITFLSYTICMLALIGLPFFSGFFSKDGILLMATIQAQQSGGIWNVIPLLGFAGVFMTAFYMIRQWRLVFFKNNQESTRTNHQAEPLLTVKIPLILLACGSLWFWYGFNPFGTGGRMVEYLFAVQDTHITWVPLVSSGLGLTAMILGYVYFNDSRIADRSSMNSEKHSSFGKLSFHGFYLDQIYSILLIKPYERLANFTSKTDQRVIDPFLHFLSISTVVVGKSIRLFDHYVIDGFVNFTAQSAKVVGWFVKRLQSNDWQTQLIYFLIIVMMVLLLVINTI